MFCGFGAVVLLVLIINTNIVESRKDKVADRRLELLQQQQVTTALREKQKQLENDDMSLKRHINSLSRSHKLVSKTINGQVDISDKQPAQEASREITKLENELKILQSEKTQLETEIKETRNLGSKVRQFEGEGNRQYLTGLKLGGKRTLLLIDSSASMLDIKIVDIIRLKVRDESTRRSTEKWQKAVATVEWIVANLPPDSSIQMFSFNTEIIPLTKEKTTSWEKTSDFLKIDARVERLKQLAPEKGTSLELAFRKARTISPRPDNIILITDGLPTQGNTISPTGAVSGEKRVRLFEQAVKNLPSGVPVNIILFPIEGDPMSSVLFWKLAIDSGGSFFTPTRDWP